METENGQRFALPRDVRDGRDHVLPIDFRGQSRLIAAKLIEKNTDFAVVPARNRIFVRSWAAMVRVPGAMAMIMGLASRRMMVMMGGRQLVQAVAKDGNAAVNGEQPVRHKFLPSELHFAPANEG